MEGVEEVEGVGIVSVENTGNAEFVPFKDIPGLSDVISKRIQEKHPEIDFTKFEDSFVYLISVFTPKDSVIRLFRTDFNHMEWMCRKTFGCGFKDAYTFFKDATVQECCEMFKDFAEQGMAYPQQVLAKYLIGFRDADDDHVKSYNIKVIGNVPVESREN